MIHSGMLAALIGCSMGPAAPPPQMAGPFAWKKATNLTYRVEHITTIIDEADGTKSKATTKLNETKRWQVLDVDKVGVGTLQLSLTAMRLELVRSDGGTLLFDSDALEKSNPRMREQLSKYVGVPLAVLRVDASGKVVEVKQSKFGPASRFESEPPFVVVLPTKPSLEWERTYQITLEPPQGAGEKFDAVQKYKGGVNTIELTTTIKALPASAADQIHLLPFQPSGRVTFDVANGRMQRAELTIDKELIGHQGKGSRYHLTSMYKEELVGD